MVSKDAYYFSHDSNARNDPKVLVLRAKHGNVAYAVYFMVIEMMREQAGYKFDASDPDMLYASIALGVGESAAFVASVIDLSVKIGLLKMDAHLYSESLLRRMDSLEESRQKRADAGRRGGHAKAEALAMLQQSPSNATALPEQCSSKALAKPWQNPSSKVKESKVNESKEIKVSEVGHDAKELTAKLVALMVKNDPQARIPPDLGKWEAEADRLLRIDCRPITEAGRVLEWAQASTFWKANILSVSKFREKYTTLKLQMQSDGGRTPVVGVQAAAGKYDGVSRRINVDEAH